MLWILAACASQRTEAPSPNQISRPPDLTGVGVLVLPVQTGPVPTAQPSAAPRYDGVRELDAELAYWLRERASTVKWITPEAIDRVLARNPALNVSPRELEVNAFRRAQVKRIGDPLFGDLRKLVAVLDARLALIPVAAEFKTAGASDGRIEVALALVDTSFGDVLWFGIVAGDNAPANSPALAANAAQRIAQMFTPARSQ